MTLMLKPGDFTSLAHHYSQYRPGYSPSVLKALLGLFGTEVENVDFVDVGAGTGIWTRMAHAAGVRTTTAIEPNADMRSNGIKESQGTSIRWLSGSAEQTGLAEASADWLSMASSFHWTETDTALREFHRVLRPEGRFTALWNPRLIESNPLFVEIEAHLSKLCPDMRRVSSGRSGITETLTERLEQSPYFEDVVYVEGRHAVEMSPSHYIGAWRSVNDVQTQLGSEKFAAFLKFVGEKIAALSVVEVVYLTRAWSARRIS